MFGRPIAKWPQKFGSNCEGKHRGFFGGRGIGSNKGRSSVTFVTWENLIPFKMSLREINKAKYNFVNWDGGFLGL